MDEQQQHVESTIFLDQILREPIQQNGNAGFEGAIIIGKLPENKEVNFGFNAATRQVRRPGCPGRHRSGQGDPLGEIPEKKSAPTGGGESGKRLFCS